MDEVYHMLTGHNLPWYTHYQSTSMNIIDIKNVTKKFKEPDKSELIAVNDASFSVSK